MAEAVRLIDWRIMGGVFGLVGVGVWVLHLAFRRVVRK